MKKIITLTLLICFLFIFIPTSTFAAEKITTFNAVMNKAEPGIKRTDVAFTLSDDRLEVKSFSLNGKFGENDTILELKSYSGILIISIKDGLDARFDDEITTADIQIPDRVTGGSVKVLPSKKAVSISFTIKTTKSVETLAAEKLAEENAHKHCYCGGYIIAENHTTHTDTKFIPWDGKSKITYNNNNEAFVYLSEDVVRDTTFTVPGDKKLNLCMNGHSITMTGNDRVININTGGILRLSNCTKSPNAKIQGGKNQYGGGVHVGGTFEMYGGIITKNYGGYGGGVYNNRYFYLYGGDVYDNKGEYGGGVWNNNDSSVGFVMYNGTISLNTAGFAGGVWCNNNSTFVMKGGNIENNVTGGAGGGIYINDKATLELEGGFILENYARWGGGIWNNGGNIFIKGGCISHNTASFNSPKPLTNPNSYGGGIWNNGEGLIYMTAGEITFNRAAYGGGVWCNDDSTFVMSGGVIAENEANTGAGIYIQNSEKAKSPGVFRLTGKAGILFNYAAADGGGAYVKGILNMDGEGEIISNYSSKESTADIATEKGSQINKSYKLPTQFMDVPNDAYYLEPLKWALEQGITTGTTEITFSPDEKCSRGQVITFIYRMHGSPETNGFYYADTSPSDYFYDATRWAWELKMERTNAFSPNYQCARSAAIRYMWIAAGSPEPTKVHSFTDIPSDANYSKAVSWAVEKGITGGTTATTFSPGDACTRAQMITFLYRAFK